MGERAGDHVCLVGRLVRRISRGLSGRNTSRLTGRLLSSWLLCRHTDGCNVGRFMDCFEGWQEVRLFHNYHHHHHHPQCLVMQLQ